MIKETKREYYSNGQLNWEWNFQNGVLHGLQRWWYPNAQLMREEYFENGEKNGLCRYWLKNGQLSWEEYFSNGKLMTEETKPMNHAEIAQQKRTKFLELLRELDAPAAVKTELLNAFFNSDSAAWKDGFEAANAIHDRIKC